MNVKTNLVILFNVKLTVGNFGFGLKTKYCGCCEYFVIKARYCYKLTEPYISWRDAAVLEPIGVACKVVLVGVALETIKIDSAINDWVLNSIQISAFELLQCNEKLII